jgi:hypothetical protein
MRQSQYLASDAEELSVQSTASRPKHPFPFPFDDSKHLLLARGATHAASPITSTERQQMRLERLARRYCCFPCKAAV